MHSKAVGISGNELEEDENFDVLDKGRKSTNNSQWNSTLGTIEPVDRYENPYTYNEDTTFQNHVMNALMNGKLEIIQEYLKCYNINDCLYNGWTPLLYGTSCAEREVVEYLLLNGADANKHKDGYTPLMALCNSTKGSIETRLQCLALLMKAGIDVDARGKRSETALMYACSTQNIEFVSELIKYVKNVNLQDSTRRTALMYAVTANKPDVVKLLLDNAADITISDYNDLTAEDIAVIKGYTEILPLLNFSESEVTNTHELFQACSWKDMFSMLTHKRRHTIDFDISTILYGMGLDKYINNFEEVELKKFLKLTEDDLNHLGVDINAHRVQFMENLHKFHKKKWNTQSITVINKSLPYTVYDGVVSLGTIAKHMTVIGSSFQYIRNSVLKANVENSCLTHKNVCEFKQEIKEVDKVLFALKEELLKAKRVADKLNRMNDIGTPAVYINPRNNKTNWTVIFSITIIIGMYLAKAVNIRDVWNN